MESRGRLYVGAVGQAVLQGLVTTAWVASDELPVRSRRLTRLGMAVAIAVGVAVFSPDATQDEVAEPPQPQPSVAKPAATPARVAAMAALVPALAVGPVVLRRRLERRWLGQLTRSGHPHPHRVVAVRIGSIGLLLTLVSGLIEAHQAATAPPRRSG